MQTRDGAPGQGHSRCKGPVVEKWWEASVKGVEGHWGSKHGTLLALGDISVLKGVS